ncbi:hypothetical protein HPP92_005086 [Vanilla planifolia]|uniref:Amino acid transporter transmembrane domain-containing protein n=1 Tax=Vanilla planifolia TaxID=51239 RepID=A0A835RT71_VANPL|nr:hypothetical protein HPP92_005086 [Vanilla planifolia]
MKNSVSDRDLYEGGSDEDSEGVDEEGSRDEVTTDHEEESIESDDSVGSPRRSRPNSYHTVWPQSYRQSINIYSSVTPPTIGFLATPGLSRLGSSISSSFRSHTHEVLSSLIRPLLPTKSEDEQQQLSEDVGRRKSSQMLLSPSIPARQPSWKKDTRKRRSTTGFPDELPAASRQCSYAQAVINAGGVIASILVVVCLFWVGLVDHIGFKKGGSSINISGIPIAIGLYGYAYSGHAVFPNIYTSLKKPNDFPAVLLTSFAFCTILFAGVAAMGFAMFGDSTQSQFTLNMPQELVASRIAVWTTVVNPITKYPLFR